MVWGKICSEKIPWGKKMGLGKKNGLWENLYSPFRFTYLLTCLLVELNQKSHNRIGTYRYSYDDDIPESFIHRLYFLLLRDLQ